MDERRLDGINAKLDRADEHLMALTDEVHRFIESEPNAYRTHVDHAAGRYGVCVAFKEQAPARLAILCGDYVHCLRSALDHLAHGIVPTSTRRIAYPIYPTPKDFSENVTPATKPQRGRLFGLDPLSPVFTYIEQTQPYNGPHGIDSHPLWLLAQLSDADKHRAILTLARATARATSLSIKGEPGIEFIGKAAYLYDFALEDGTEIISGQFKPVTEGQPKVHVHGELPLDVAFGKEGIPCATLHMLRDAAREITLGVQHYSARG